MPGPRKVSQRLLKQKGEPSIAQQSQLNWHLIGRQLNTLSMQADCQSQKALEDNLRRITRMLEVTQLQKEFLERDGGEHGDELKTLSDIWLDMENLKKLNESLLAQNPQQLARQTELLKEMTDANTVPDYKTLLLWQDEAKSQSNFQNTCRKLVMRTEQCANQLWNNVVAPFLVQREAIDPDGEITCEKLMNELHLLVLGCAVGKQESMLEEYPYRFDRLDKPLDLVEKLLNKEPQAQKEQLEKLKKLRAMLQQARQALSEQVPKMKSLLKDMEQSLKELSPEAEKGKPLSPRQIERIREMVRLHDQQCEEYANLTDPIEKRYHELVDPFLERYTGRERQEMGETDLAVLRTILNLKEQEGQQGSPMDLPELNNLEFVQDSCEDRLAMSLDQIQLDSRNQVCIGAEANQFNHEGRRRSQSYHMRRTFHP